MRHGALTVVVASCVLLAACNSSGSDSDASTTIAIPARTAAVTTTEPPAPSTEAPTTTIDTEAHLAAAEKAYVVGFDAYIAAARDPSNPELRAEIERLFTGPSLEFTLSQLDTFVRNSWVALPTEQPSRTIILVSPQFVPERSDIVELVSCEVNAERIVEVGGAPDGSDALVTDEVTVDRLVVRLRLVDGTWRPNSGEVIAELGSPEECEP